MATIPKIIPSWKRTLPALIWKALNSVEIYEREFLIAWFTTLPSFKSFFCWIMNIFHDSTLRWHRNWRLKSFLCLCGTSRDPKFFSFVYNSRPLIIKFILGCEGPIALSPGISTFVFASTKQSIKSQHDLRLPCLSPVIKDLFNLMPEMEHKNIVSCFAWFKED